MKQSLEYGQAYCQSVIDRRWAYVADHSEQIQRILDQGPWSRDDCDLMRRCLAVVLMELSIRRLDGIMQQLRELEQQPDG